MLCVDDLASWFVSKLSSLGHTCLHSCTSVQWMAICYFFIRAIIVCQWSKQIVVL